MSSRNFSVFAFVQSAVVHVTVIALLLFSWNSTDEVINAKPLPKHVTAVVVEKPVTKPKAQPKPAPKPKQPVKPKPEKKPEPKPKPKPEVKPKPKAQPPKPEPKVESKVKPQKEDTSKSFSDLLKQEMESIKQDEPAMSVESNEPSAKEMDEILQYQSLIQQTVKRYWIRPPSARNDMIVMLDIQLLPGGELKSVKIDKSSSNSAFDSSAVLAVQKAGRFSVPSDPELFNRHFRIFKMRFKPGDLRY